jgi:hypothetical protein
LARQGPKRGAFSSSRTRHLDRSTAPQIKPKHLNGASFDAPSSSSTHTLGQVKRKHEAYDLWSLGDRGDNDVDHDQIGGDEMNGLSCLLPRKSKEGKLYLGENLFRRRGAFLLVTDLFCIGPKPITRRLILAASPPVPAAHTPAVLNQNPPRHSYPTERFTHRWTPYGSSTLDPAMDVDASPKPKKRSKPTDGPKKASRKPRAGKP